VGAHWQCRLPIKLGRSLAVPAVRSLAEPGPAANLKQAWISF
jgi:hypothetical protein